MSVFGRYSSYYDLLYKDKNYSGEAQFVRELLETFAPGAHHLLDLGCGSGGHAFELARQGFSLHCVDLSRDMLAEAKRQLAQQPADIQSRLRFSQGDIRQFELGRQFDCAISLFHVISYLPTLGDIRQTFQRVHDHLRPGGVFLFDVWYAPAVLTERPEVRVKRMANAEISVTRIAEPVWHPNECWVDVCYKVFIRDLKTDQIEELETEVHRMRYLSLPEITLLAEMCKLEVVHTGEWMTQNPPSEKTWGVCFVLKKAARS
jgi:SAM-dependent methyltransferase